MCIGGAKLVRQNVSAIIAGKELDLFDLQEDFSIHRQHIGYGSIHDGDNVDLQLCCDCFDKLVSECNVSPIEEVDDE